MNSGDRGALNRRTVLAGLASLAAVEPGHADGTASPIAHGVLAQNRLALAFEEAPSRLPDVVVAGPNGKRNISDLLGRTLLMPLWAEWCAPCLKEISDFAWLQQKYGNSKFGIVPVLTGAKKKVTPAIIGEFFTILHATVFEPLMEERFGDTLLERMARQGHELAIPCNLLIAPNGHVMGREIGLKANDGTQSDQSDSTSGNLSLWGTRVGEEFAAAMANGFIA